MPRLGICPLVALVVLTLAGCGSNKATPTSPTPSPAPPAAGAPIKYTALGASDAVGVGASVLCIPYAPCPNGTGYVPDIARQLQSAGHPTVTLMNMGIPAAVIGADIQAIGVAAGRTDIPGNFIEQEMPFVPRNSTVITIFAGANDVRVIVDAVNHGAGGSNVSGYVDAQIRTFAADYQTLVKGIRSRAPNAWIVVANLPNFAGLPYTSGYSTAGKQLVQKISVGFTTQAINPLVAQSIPVVDLMCDARSYQAGIYYSDGFHPNDTGYAYIASEFIQAITSAGHAAPQASCAAMTLVPPM